MSSLKRILLPALLLASAGCNDVLFLELEQPALCKTVVGQTFGGSQYSTTLDIDVAQELQGLGVDSPEGIELFVSMERARLIARSGVTDFDFIDSARILVVSVEPDGPPPAEALSYTRTGPTGAEVELNDGGKLNLSEYITQDTLRVEAAISGRLPSEDWSVDIEVCLYGRARVNYLEFLDAQP